MNGFALTPGIGRHDDTVGTVENLFNGQVLTPETRIAVCFGHGELDEMAERPGNEVAVT